MGTVIIVERSKKKPRRRRMVERLGIAGIKMLIALSKVGRVNSLKEWAREAKVGMSQIYNRMRILEKLGYIEVDDTNPYRVKVAITEKGKQIAELAIELENAVRQDLKAAGLV